MSRPGNVLGAPGLSSIAWSHMRDGGNWCEASSLKTLVKEAYCGGIVGIASVVGRSRGWVEFFWPKVNGVNSSGGSGSMMMRPMNIWSVGGVLI